jgi:HSP20 family protein
MPFEKLKQELENLLEAAKSNSERALDALGLKTCKAWAPPVDIVESESYVIVVADLPGVDPHTVDVSLSGNMLTIKGDRLARATLPGEMMHVAERSAGPFMRSIPLPAPVDSDQVTADARNGTLTIRLLKPPTARPKSIPIEIKSQDTTCASGSVPPVA